MEAAGRVTPEDAAAAAATAQTERMIEQQKKDHPDWYYEGWDGTALGAVKYPGGHLEAYCKRLYGNFGKKFCLMLISAYLAKGSLFQFVAAGQLPYFKKYMKVSGDLYQQYGTVATTPWAMKPIIGALSDSVPIGGYHKRYYIVIGVFLGTSCFIFLGFGSLAHNLAWVAALLFFVANLEVAIVDLLCEGKYAELMQAKPHTGSDMVTWVWLFVSLGGLIASALTGPVADNLSPKYLYIICLPISIQLLFPCLMGWLPEKQIPEGERGIRYDKLQKQPKLFLLSMLMSGCAVGMVFFNLMNKPLALLIYSVTVSIVLCVLAQMWMPKLIARCNLYMYLSSVLYITIPGAQDYYYTADKKCVPDGPHFDYTFYQTYTMIVGSIVSIFGVMLFQNYLSKYKIRLAFWTTTLLGILAGGFDVIIVLRWNVKYLGIPDKWMYMLGDAIIQNVIVMMNFMPAVTLTSKLCPKGAEATVYALLAGFQNFGGQVARSLGSYVMDYSGIKTTVPCDFSTLPMVLFITHMIIPLVCVPLTFVLIPDAYFSTDFESLGLNEMSIDDRDTKKDEDEALISTSRQAYGAM